MFNTTIIAKNGNFNINIFDKNNYKKLGENTIIVLLMDNNNKKVIGFNSENKARILFAFTHEDLISIFFDYQMNNFNSYIFHEPSDTSFIFYTLKEFFQKNPSEKLMLNPNLEVDYREKPFLQKNDSRIPFL